VLDAQLGTLRRHGYRPISAEEFLRFLRGAGVPDRAVLVTFDDAYADFASTALPILERHGIKPVVFAVSRHLGGFNEWDQAIGAPNLSLLGAADLRDCVRRGCEIGAHSQTHAPLPGLGWDQLVREIDGALEDLEMAGLPRPRLFAYPYGAHDDRVLSAAGHANLGAAFTVAPGLVRRTSDPLAVPRIEIFRSDTGWRFRLKVATAGHFPTWLRLAWASLRSRLRKITRPPGP
jgi:peptidoglycan/xylan/chitin deacetylase (PgdA/CDA1 family)